MDKSEKIIFNKKSLTRLMAVQIFYQYEFHQGKFDLEQITNEIVNNYTLRQEEETTSYKSKINLSFLQNLTIGLQKDRENIDNIVKKYLKEPFNIDKIDDIILQILRFGTFELKYVQDSPAKVVLDEYVDIAASFFADKKVTFINAILDKIAREFRKSEFENDTKK